MALDGAILARPPGEAAYSCCLCSALRDDSNGYQIVVVPLWSMDTVAVKFLMLASIWNLQVTFQSRLLLLAESILKETSKRTILKDKESSNEAHNSSPSPL
eukprot:scaffold2715_cov137-Skeletonema_dohrnii-CCMP3373.AAC.1